MDDSKKSECELDAVVVGAPVDDVLLDGLGFEALGDGLVDELEKPAHRKASFSVGY